MIRGDGHGDLLLHVPLLRALFAEHREGASKLRREQLTSHSSTLGCSQPDTGCPRPSWAKSARVRSCFPAGTDNLGGEESYTGKSSFPHASRQARPVASPGCPCPRGVPAAPCWQLQSLGAAGTVAALTVAAVTVAPSIPVPQGTSPPRSSQGWQTGRDPGCNGGSQPG